MSRLCIIPARGGSKRIPRKNIKLFLGKPIIAYSIKAALESGLFDEVMVSTDDVDIAEIAKEYGAVVPFLRSAQNADDYATTYDVIKEVLEKISPKSYASVCCLYATAPFVTADLLTLAANKLESTDFETVFPVVEFGFPIQRALHLNNVGGFSFREPAHALTRSQDLAPTYHDAGMFYWFRPETTIKVGKLIGDNASGIIVDALHAEDIDTATDWDIAEFKYQYLHKHG